jgi:L,D-transpeptidase catalytic domain
MVLVFGQRIMQCAVALIASAGLAATSFAQAPIVFVPGTGVGNGDISSQRSLRPPPADRRPMIACATLPERTVALLASDKPAPLLALKELTEASLTATPPAPTLRLDPTLLKTALASYTWHACANTTASVPAQIFVIDFAKRSDQPRLYRVDLRNGDGIDTPTLVAHGIGSDPDDDGVAQSFGNVQDSLMSSLGAVRGAEIYDGINGRSLRLDGLDRSNQAMRARDIVAHSYTSDAFRYFNAAFRAYRGGKPGTSEGCFVVEPSLRDWLFAGLSDGGFLYAGLGGVESAKTESTKAIITFVAGTGN